ncbi:olfactory receptor 2A5-like [Talpa occidentalis]|uniref:olfactory receptor 2A5-like n=1 Tax=Talpa occidentalis TaxID=50954 RepID=UPI00188E8F3C|nr:olfactory receptor 2A5-like [Talpa occidentalis]XP_037378669.1 olfactory receptor 2A5-like [Talpa occidentalis]
MGDNQSWVPEFILVGFQLSAEIEVFLFCIFCLLYVSNLLANGMILGLIWLDVRLHTPMYFFLSHLAVIDISYSSSSLPNIMENLLKHKKTISFVSCTMQMILYSALAIIECAILMVMSYDRYVAICHPLHYMVIMNWRLCTVLTSISWAYGFILALVNIILYLRLPYCRVQKVNHLFCEIIAVLKVACGDTWLNKIVVLSACVFIILGPLSLMMFSYIRILLAILKIKSKEGRREAFSTCSSHLCVVGFYFGIAMMMYLVPDNGHRDEQKKILSLFYTLFNPLLNPLVYSLRNAQMKAAFNKVVQKRGSI